ncbi:MAG TPA: acetyl-CoA carboxylase carboxyltransferase subunit alpha [Ktedonobacterales bacterium]|nr:acetyl-CoA carboxylase carboxyltransferase subunit alpha [Ktedonobacterales bacterium]
MTYDLDFEKPLADLDKRIQNLRARRDKTRTDELIRLEGELEQQTREIYSHLSPWQRVQIARHKNRPYTADYIRLLFTDFFELRGDRRFADDRAILGGVASFGGQTVMVIGHQKGRDTKERMESNFGMPHPEGYRKAQRLMQHAERFGFPVLAFIDTAGAALDLDAEERGIAQAIAENLFTMTRLRTPIIATVIGEGGSGGALGIGVADRTLMLENSIYTVASPEAAASILWKDAAFAPQAAEAMKITAPDLLRLNLIDRVIPEPLGGAHRDHRAAAEAVREAVREEISALTAQPVDMLLSHRYARLRAIGSPEGAAIL